MKQLDEEARLAQTGRDVVGDRRTADTDAADGRLAVVEEPEQVVQVGQGAAAQVLDLPERADRRLLDGPLTCYGTVVLVPDLLDAPSLWVRPRDFVGILGLEVTSNLTRPFARWLKRTMDLTVALLGAVLWMPVVALLAGVEVGEFESLGREDGFDATDHMRAFYRRFLAVRDLPFPVIVKPNYEGSSKGIYNLSPDGGSARGTSRDPGASSVVKDAKDLPPILRAALRAYPDGVLVEEYVTGREFTVGLLGDRRASGLGVAGRGT